MLTVLRFYCSLVDRIVGFSGKAVAWLMPVLAFVVVAEVFSRYVLDKPTIWAYDLSLFLFGYIAALGGAYAQQRRAHINVDIVYLKVSANTRRIFDLISYSLTIFFLAVLVYICWGKFNEALQFNYRRQSEWAPPMFHFWIMLMVAGGLFIAQLSRDMLDQLVTLFTGEPLLAREATDDLD